MSSSLLYQQYFYPYVILYELYIIYNPEGLSAAELAGPRLLGSELDLSTVDMNTFTWVNEVNEINSISSCVC
jgi:hypothetical protein